MTDINSCTGNFTSDQIIEIESWFYDKCMVVEDPEGVSCNCIVTSVDFLEFLNLQKLHRRSFKYPSKKEVIDSIEKFGPKAIHAITKEQIYFILRKCPLHPTLRHELLLAFKVFDTEDCGYLEIDELKTVLCDTGDNILTEEEMKEFVRDADARGTGLIYYEDFINSLFRLAPELENFKVDYIYEDPDSDPSVPPLPVEQESELAQGETCKVEPSDEIKTEVVPDSTAEAETIPETKSKFGTEILTEPGAETGIQPNADTGIEENTNKEIKPETETVNTNIDPAADTGAQSIDNSASKTTIGKIDEQAMM